ncbi:MAG: CsgG/HfaB family protein [Crocinitomicaceae bacterium]|nr:CsgG/HfaB family protein [Crocinitomicaceae bacterium]MDG1776996.1 CsgG/HfaB family protein [Crocinitomicaceae bacterium]
MLKYLSLLITILLFSCSGSKKMLKKGHVLEHNKQYVEASNFYFEALNRKNSNVDASIALNRVGDKVLNQYLNDFYKKESIGDVKSAVYAYLKAFNYQKKLNQYKIYKDIPNHYLEKYENVKRIYLKNLYEEGENLMSELSYKNAEICFIEILKFNAEYEDAKQLRDIAYVEPLFIKAKIKLEGKNYRDAYNNFVLVLERIPNYKDALESKAQALELGRHNFLIFTFENITHKKHIETKISNYISNELSNLNDPFLRLVDRANFEKIMSEQELALSGFVDESKAAEIGKLLGAQKAISGKVISYSHKVNQSQPQKKQAAESYTVRKKRVDGEGYTSETKYKKVNYTSYNKSVDVHVEFHYKLISLETSEVLLSDIIDISSNDVVSYSVYNGDSKKLHAISNSGIEKGYSSTTGKLRSQFSKRKTLKSEKELSNDLFKSISGKVSKKITQYIE